MFLERLYKKFEGKNKDNKIHAIEVTGSEMRVVRIALKSYMAVEDALDEELGLINRPRDKN